MGFTWNAGESVRFMSKEFKEIKEQLLLIQIELEKIKQKIYEQENKQ